MSMTYHTPKIDREALRRKSILDQVGKAEQGIAEIIDGSHLAEIHLRNALEISIDAHQATALAETLSRLHNVRVTTWGILGKMHSDRMGG